MTAAAPEILSFPPGPPPSVPDAPPLAEELTAPPIPGPTLADAALGTPPAPESGAPEVPDAPPMSPEQIIGVVAELSAFGLPQGLADAYKDDFKSNPLVAFGVQASGLADALAAYGLTAGGGKLPEWLSVSLGVVVLGWGVYTTRSKYVKPLEHAARPAEEVAGAGFAGAGHGTPLAATNIGFSGAGAGGSGE
ncbi:hypothetical protein [Deinococcus sp. YIM 77859]|uniref:hypothetical protein n=1 Tax=Deinococcus sp. YIM 77859 TaxID=1540221 RepID=UPI00054E20AE|nr:hypothetical protein [Deinococcus sp. YIM 77859]